MTSGYQGKIIGTVVEEEKPRPKPVQLYVFHEQSAQIMYRHGTKILEKDSTFTDYYGEGTCVPTAIEEAEDRCRVYSITPESTLVVEVHLITEETTKKKTGKTQYFHPDVDEYEQVGCTQEIKEEIVWTSKKGLLKEPICIAERIDGELVWSEHDGF
jgi:hypothetical protein